MMHRPLTFLRLTLPSPNLSLGVAIGPLITSFHSRNFHALPAVPSALKQTLNQTYINV